MATRYLGRPEARATVLWAHFYSVTRTQPAQRRPCATWRAGSRSANVFTPSPAGYHLLPHRLLPHLFLSHLFSREKGSLHKVRKDPFSDRGLGAWHGLRSSVRHRAVGTDRKESRGTMFDCCTGPRHPPKRGNHDDATQPWQTPKAIPAWKKDWSPEPAARTSTTPTSLACASDNKVRMARVPRCVSPGRKLSGQCQHARVTNSLCSPPPALSRARTAGNRLWDCV
jgi:hypothetical protein